MRSIGLLLVVTATLVLAASCSDGAGTPPRDNTAPVANFDLPSCTLDAPCEFVSTSTDDDEVLQWTWDLNGDNASDASTATASYTYRTAGTFNVSLTVFDAEGLSHKKTSSITIAPPAVNTPPTAGFTHTCNGLECTFTSTSSDAAPGTIATYAWTFGDDATADVANPSHTYTVTGATDFTVTLTVTDNEGATDLETQTLTATPAAPVNPPSAGFTHSCAMAVCTFASTSSDVAPGTIAGYAWTFGDGGTATGNSVVHTYAVTAAAPFSVTLTVTDSDGWTDVETRTITVDPLPPTNAPPTARFTYSCIAAVCTFVNSSFDHGGRIARQAWTFGDGGSSTVSTVSHDYAVTGPSQFTVTLTVTDNGGATAVASQDISIDPTAANLPPTASFVSWCYGDGCLFTSKSTDPAPGKIFDYAWSFGDGVTAEWKNWAFSEHREAHSYTVSARTQFPVTLTVTDNEGATAVSTQIVTVSPLPPAAQGCTTSGSNVECVLDIPTRSTLRLTLNGISCSLDQKISVPPPSGDQMFLAVCGRKVGDTSGIFGGAMDELWVYEAGGQARIWFTRATSKLVLNPPEGRLEGTWPNWTLSFEDGDHPGAPGEPDFSDVVIGVRATAR
jgi:PKD repeat protein